MRKQIKSTMDFEFKRKKQGRIITKRVPLSAEIKKSITWLIFTLIFLIILLSIVYLLNTTQSSQKGYQLKQEQIKKEQLELQNRDLITKIISAMSYHKIETSKKVESMLKAENLLYIED